MRLLSDIKKRWRTTHKKRLGVSKPLPTQGERKVLVLKKRAVGNGGTKAACLWHNPLKTFIHPLSFQAYLQLSFCCRYK